MPEIKTEKPPVERKPPMSEGLKTTLMVVAVVFLAVAVGLILQNAGPGRVFTGILFLICLIWFFMVQSRGREDLGTDGHGRRDSGVADDDYRW